MEQTAVPLKATSFRHFKKPDALTKGEQKIWDLYQAGKTEDEIAAELGLKPISVKTRLYHIKEKVRT